MKGFWETIRWIVSALNGPSPGLFGMALRQMTRFVEPLLRLIGLTWAMPDFSTLSRRQKTLAVNIPYRRSNGPLHLLIDSTGIKVEGESEWHARKKGGTKRRFWHNIHNHCPTMHVYMLDGAKWLYHAHRNGQGFSGGRGSVQIALNQHCEKVYPLRHRIRRSRPTVTIQYGDFCHTLSFGVLPKSLNLLA